MMRNKLYLILALLMVASLVLAACGGGGEQASTGGCDLAQAEELFNQTVIVSQPGCVTCHSLDEGVVLVGPSLAGIGARAATTVDGQSAAKYIEASIVNPDGYLVEGFTAGTMPSVWADELSDEQIKCLVSYLETLK